MNLTDEKKEPILQCRNLIKAYRIDDEVVVAVRGIDLDVYPGEIVCIVGTSGSGKSTLLYMLAGIERPTKGQIRIAGKRTEALSENDLVHFRLKNVGFIFQSFNLMMHMTAVDNVALPMMLRGIGVSKRRKAAAVMLKNVGLEKRMHHKPNQLSGGQQQRVSIARALITKPKIIFADEPTGNLDSKTTVEIMELLKKEVKESGSTLIMVTHDVENADYADRVVKIIDGRVVETYENAQKKG